MSIDQSKTENNFTNTGLYSGNVIIEYNTDQKVVKPVIKINEKADPTAILHAVNMAIIALRESVKALDANDFIIPDPTKHAIKLESEEPDDSNITKIRDKEDDLERLQGDQLGMTDPDYEAKKIIDGSNDDDQIYSIKDAGVDHTK